MGFRGGRQGLRSMKTRREFQQHEKDARALIIHRQLVRALTESHNSTSGLFLSVERCSSSSAENWYRNLMASEAKLTIRLPSVADASFRRVSLREIQPPVPQRRLFQLPLHKESI